MSVISDSHDDNIQNILDKIDNLGRRGDLLPFVSVTRLPPGRIFMIKKVNENKRERKCHLYRRTSVSR